MGRYAAVVTELIARMNFHKGTGQMLQGLGFRETPEVQTDGLKDFPWAMFFLPSITESYHVRNIADSTLRLNLAITTDRKYGIPALLVWVEKVMDALETNRTTLAYDPNLGGTTKPFEMEMANAFALDLSLTAQITITVMPKPMQRGQRRNSS